MSRQNIYDNELFFENFKRLRGEELNFNDVIETPIILGIDSIADKDGSHAVMCLKIANVWMDESCFDEKQRGRYGGKKIGGSPLF